MKKLLLLLLLILTLTSCNTVTDELPQGEDLTIEQAYTQYGKMVEQFQREFDENSSFDSVYYKNEYKEIEYNKSKDRDEEKYTTTIITLNKVNYHYHCETYFENKTSESSSTEVVDAYVKDEKLHYFRTYTIDKRVAYKKYYICDVDYLWSEDYEYSGHVEEILGEVFIENVEERLSKEDHRIAIRGNYYFITPTNYTPTPSLEKFTEYLSDAETLAIRNNKDTGQFSFYSTFAVDSEVIEYNLSVKGLVVYTSGLLTDYKQNFYNGNYWYQTYQYNIDIPLPTFNLSDYEETEPSRFSVAFVDWEHNVY